ncbi:MAG: MBOAT family protein [Bryobacterales bacterium]|nr:MBOAT family protein [Bryobacterales bacterium]
MVFDSFGYLAFLLLAWAGVALLRKRGATAWLVLASYFFYSLAAWWYPILLLGTSAAAWFCGNAARGTGNGPRRKLAAGIGIALTLAPLLAFKYGGHWLPLARGMGTWQDPQSWAMPLGLSFYALQAIAWLVDCARGDIAERPPFMRFLLFFSFFPKLSAGPILRHDDFFPTSRQVVLNSNVLWQAALLFTHGVFKKVVIADNAALAANALFAAPDTTGPLALFGMLAYSMQIYCDFAGYTDMALASGLLLGIRLPRNFHWPYLATNPAEFWRRWHITLSHWLRDYVYLALPGIRRRRALPVYGGLLLTMLVCGLWHGSTLPFAAWGLYWGALMLAYRLLQPRLERFWHAAILPRWALTLAAVAMMQALTAAGWVFFRAESLSSAGRVFASMAGGGWVLPAGAALTEQQLLVAILLTGFWLFHWKALHAPLLRNLEARPWQPTGVAWVLLLLSLAAVFRVPNAVPFLYFRF